MSDPRDADRPPRRPPGSPLRALDTSAGDPYAKAKARRRDEAAPAAVGARTARDSAPGERSGAGPGAAPGGRSGATSAPRASAGPRPARAPARSAGAAGEGRGDRSSSARRGPGAGSRHAPDLPSRPRREGDEGPRPARRNDSSAGPAGRRAGAPASRSAAGRNSAGRTGPRGAAAKAAAAAKAPAGRTSAGKPSTPASPALPVSDHPGAQVRALAARVLDAVLHGGRSLKAELGQVLPVLADPRDRALLEAICFAVLRQPLRYERALEAWMPRPLSRRDGPVRALLLAGLAQLDPLRLPEHAAVDATVEAARALGHSHQAALVNALLRRAQRDGLPAVDPSHSHWPSWLRGRLRRDWPAHYAGILAESALAPPMWLRVRGDREAYRARLAAAGLEAPVEDEAPPQALRLAQAVPVAGLPGFAEGEVSVQDVSAQWAVQALAPPPGARVLDACAAPGGKTAHLLERDPAAQVLALDLDPARLQRVRAGLVRLGLEARAELRAADAADRDAWWDGRPFDAILLDAPCSATGIVRRQPDVVLHRRESDIAALNLVQARLLDALWPTLAPGGALVYATCSILQDENEAQVRAFLARTPDAEAEPLDARYGHDRGVGRQRLPGEAGGDGFFYARLRRRPAADGAAAS